MSAVGIGQAAGRDVIVSGSGDGTVRIWDLTTGRLVGDPLTGHTGALFEVVRSCPRKFRMPSELRRRTLANAFDRTADG